MTARKFITEHPFDANNFASKADYFRWCSQEISKRYNVTITAKHFKRKFYELEEEERNVMMVVRESFDKDGNVTNTTKALRPISQVNTEGMTLKKVTKNAYGGEWATYEPGVIDYTEAIDSVVKKYYKKRKIYKRSKNKVLKACKVIISDAHVGMDATDGIFDYEWNPQRLNDAFQKVFDSAVAQYDLHGRFEVLYLDSLGDMLDGYNGQTTRQAHPLEQNLNNSEAFNAYVDAKLKLIETIFEADIADKLVVRSICNDNHAGSFGEIAELCIRKVMEKTHGDRIQFQILTKFLEHFTYGKHIDILTHGKDKKYMRGGLPLHLNPKAENFLISYIDHHNLKGFIHVCKGDLHQVGFGKSQKFDYYNFPSLAPPSAWVQTNFGDCYSGFSLMVYPKYTNEVSVSHHFLQ